MACLSGSGLRWNRTSRSDVAARRGRPSSHRIRCGAEVLVLTSARTPPTRWGIF